MTDATHLEASPPPTIMELEFSDLTASLKAGWNDFKRAPMYGLGFAAFYAMGGLLMLLATFYWEDTVTIIVIGLGFPLLAPFAAVGLYEVSRRLETGEPMVRGEILTRVVMQRNRQCPSIAMVMVMIFMFWVFVAHLVFALFMGLQPMTNVMTSLDTLLSANGLIMLAVGTAVGAMLSFILFSLTVISIPLIMDREIDFISAMIHSFTLVLNNFKVMMVWGFIMGAGLMIGMIPMFLGLFITLPVLGHATWHLYRRAVTFDE